MFSEYLHLVVQYKLGLRSYYVRYRMAREVPLGYADPSSTFATNVH